MDLQSIDLATLPAFNADSAAARRSDCIAREHRDKVATVKRGFLEHAGVELRGPFRWLQHRLESGVFYMITAHDFTSPALAGCDIAVISDRFPFSRKAIADIAAWLAFDLNVRRITARIPIGQRKTEGLAQRLGLRLTHSEKLDDGREANCWTGSPDDLLLCGTRMKG